jgi:hypothetical protein
MANNASDLKLLSAYLAKVKEAIMDLNDVGP